MRDSLGMTQSEPNEEKTSNLPGPLAGLSVLELGEMVAAPYCAKLLGDLGADVIKVERPGGDDTRGWGPPFALGEATYFWSANRNKRSVVLDLHDPGDALIAADLAYSADIVVENFRFGYRQNKWQFYQFLRSMQTTRIRFILS